MERLKEMNEEIISQIYFIRGRKVMMDSDLARIYGVETRVLNQAVKRNTDRFPVDFMFQLTIDEFGNLMLQIATSNSQNSDHKDNGNLISQFVISSSQNADHENNPNLMSQFATSSWGGRRKLPFVFTEHGALMLASVLNSPVAIQASIYVVRAFVKLRDILSMNNELSKRIDDLEKRTSEKLDEHSEQLMLVFQALRELVQQKDEPLPAVGFKYGI
jgi:ORF6N domain.